MTTTYTLGYAGAEVDDAIQFVQNSIASPYDSSSTYRINDFVIYDNALWRCNTVVSTPEPWTPAKWIETKMGAQFNKCDTAANWAASTTPPAIGEIIIYLDTLGVKVGDGVTLAKDLEFITVTAAEKAAWNNKVRCYMSSDNSTELIFTTN